MTTPRRERLRPSSPNRYEEISRHLLDQADEELDKGDVLLAPEKIWLAVAHELKGIAQHRGWNHRYHNHLRAAVSLFSRNGIAPIGRSYSEQSKICTSTPMNTSGSQATCAPTWNRPELIVRNWQKLDRRHHLRTCNSPPNSRLRKPSICVPLPAR